MLYTYPSASHISRVRLGYTRAGICDEISSIATKTGIHLLGAITLTVALIGGIVQTILSACRIAGEVICEGRGCWSRDSEQEKEKLVR